MKKFKADRLQSSCGSFADQFRISKYQVKRATDNLVRLGLIEKTFKIVPLENGGVLGNVLYIELTPKKLAEISDPPVNISTPSSKKLQYISEITTQNTTEKKILPVERPSQNHKPNLVFDLGLALAQVCGVNFEMNKGQILREAKIIHQGGGTLGQMLQNYGRGGWWYQQDFRGQQGSAPAI